MRPVTAAEVEAWSALARRHGFMNEAGDFAFGRYIVETTAGGDVSIVFITPVPAGLYTEDLQPKTPPIRFDRTSGGEIILPGRGWQRTFERISEDETAPPEIRHIAGLAARHVQATDARLPPDTETIAILAPDDQGRMIPHEALPPGTRVSLQLGPKGEG
jgi:hypothetical protein